jgi:AraC family transcriptional regulator, regulatory protein of adaptative response / methylated-DNA-[protein]-cysteine methyltransferase
MRTSVTTLPVTELHFAIGRCSLGSVLVARGERGVRAILLGDDPTAVTRELERRFPEAALVRRDEDLARSLSEVIGLVESPGQTLDLLLDLRGTSFQQRVWQALREIPAGSTATYTELASRIGSPNSVRAVAQACASNPLAVIVPCHRVLRSDGALAGYRWGLERKRMLLEREALRRSVSARLSG